MRYLIVFLVFIPITASAGSWSKQDTERQAYAIMLLTADWVQTKNILQSDDFFEMNPLISRENVDIYFLSSIILHTAIAYLLPEKPRKYWQYFFIGLEAGYVKNNMSIGVEFKF